MCVKTGGGRYMLTCSTPPVLADWTHVRLQLHAHAGHGHTSYYMKHVYGCKLQHHGRGAMPGAVALMPRSIPRRGLTARESESVGLTTAPNSKILNF